jgi:hypothetical protein
MALLYSFGNARRAVLVGLSRSDRRVRRFRPAIELYIYDPAADQHHRATLDGLASSPTQLLLGFLVPPNQCVG